MTATPAASNADAERMKCVEIRQHLPSMLLAGDHHTPAITLTKRQPLLESHGGSVSLLPRQNHAILVAAGRPAADGHAPDRIVRTAPA